MSQFFTSGGQSIGISASASVLPTNVQEWSLGLTGLISCCPRDSQESSPAPQFKSINSSGLSYLYGPTLTSIHDYWKNHSLIRWTFVGKVMSLLCNMLPRLVIAFLPRCKCLNFLGAITICSDSGAQEKTVCHCFHCFHCFPIYLPWSDGTRCHDLYFLNVEF